MPTGRWDASEAFFYHYGREVKADAFICNEQYTIDVSKLKATITPKTEAIMPVHLTGNKVRETSIRG